MFSRTISEPSCVFSSEDSFFCFNCGQCVSVFQESGQRCQHQENFLWTTLSKFEWAHSWLMIIVALWQYIPAFPVSPCHVHNLLRDHQIHNFKQQEIKQNKKLPIIRMHITSWSRPREKYTDASCDYYIAFELKQNWKIKRY